jgi:GTP cyclohydrolase IB
MNTTDVILKPRRDYDVDFRVDPDYLDRMPDLQNAGSSGIQGANVPIVQVGISGFRLPIQLKAGDGSRQRVDATVTGTVELERDFKGINMSRVMRVFYEFRERVFSFDTLADILDAYLHRLGAPSARLCIQFDYPILKRSLRSDHAGYQYYSCSLIGEMDKNLRFRKLMEFDFVYSSACPCSSELSEHAREERNVYAIPHSQRSKARVLVELKDDADMSIEDMQFLCENALKTETQVVVKREDEQAFAELNGAYTKFVEDAARLLFEQLDADDRIRDFEVALNHLESLHSHDAVAVICKGIPGGMRGNFRDFASLKC